MGKTRVNKIYVSAEFSLRYWVCHSKLDGGLVEPDNLKKGYKSKWTSLQPEVGDDFPLRSQPKSSTKLEAPNVKVLMDAK